MDKMKVYLVGGAVRDQLLNRPVKENDWVVVGNTTEAMIKQGFKPVGKDFPVFLHPETHEEYALARTERKTAKGYHGFKFYTAPDVTLEEDLKRRDLTINAIAQDERGKLIDPFNGQQDISARLFRHVSSSFEEDPVRLLRVCRFSAMLPRFDVAAETLKLMQNMVEKGEVDALVPERVWQELKKALSYEDPSKFFRVADKSYAFRRIFKEVDCISLLNALPVACQMSKDAAIRFAATFGQLNTEKAGSLCQRLRIPKEYADLLLLTCRHYSAVESLHTEPAKILDLLERLDPFRRQERFEKFLIVASAIQQAKHKKNKLAASEVLKKAHEACQTIDLSSVDKTLPGRKIAEVIRTLRLSSIKKVF